MESLGHKEFEVPATRRAPIEVVERLLAFARYVLAQGPVLNDGETIGFTADEKIPIRHRRSKWNEKQDVIQLTM
jgi:hypothetical protein